MEGGSLPEPGRYENIPAATYHAWRAFSISNGLELMTSPGHYLHRLMNPLEQTAPMRLGTLIHERLLEPGFWDRYAVMPDFGIGLRDDKGELYKNPRGTNKYKELVQEWCSENVGKTPLEPATAKTIETAYNNAMSKSTVRELLTGPGVSELSLVWDHDGWLRCKGRLDRVDSEANILIDIKTTQASGIAAFTKAIANRGQYIQLAHYKAGAAQAGIKIDGAVIVVVETTGAQGVCALQLPPAALEAGERHRLELIKRLEGAHMQDKWDSYPDQLILPDFPSWAFSSIDRALGYF